jgi:hypothetical protein
MYGNTLESPRVFKEPSKSRRNRRTLPIDVETSEKLGVISRVENPHGGQKRLVVKALVDKRYDELVKEGRIKV